MSEKRAKRERKAQVVVEAPAKKRDMAKVVANIIVVLVVIAIAALGVWAAYGKIKAELPQDQAETTQTVADLAAAESTTVEELLAKCGMADSGITGESTQEEFFAVLTVENYANYEGKPVDELKAEYGIESVENDMLWQDAQMQIPMGKVAEMQYGTTFEDFAQQTGLPEGITAEMTQGQALAIMQATQATETTEE